MVVFTLSSLAAGLAGSGGVLIGSRAIQGIGAALLMPTTLNQQCLNQQGLSPPRPWPNWPPSTSSRPS